MPTEPETPSLEYERELYLAPGGPVSKLLERSGMTRITGESVGRRIIVLTVIVWVPMCLFAVMQGRAFGPTSRESFLLDFATHARSFLAIPLLLIAETLIGGRLAEAGREFVRRGLVLPSEYTAFENAVARLARWRDSVPAAIVLAVLAVVGTGNLITDGVGGVSWADWYSIPLAEGQAVRYPLAALWNRFVAEPIVLFLVYTWVWRIVIWTVFLHDLARMNLQLVPTHADRSGGLGFLEIAHASFGILAFAVSGVLSAGAAFRIVYEGASLNAFYVPLGVALVLLELLFLGPLLVFSPLMLRTRRVALLTYGRLVVRYNIAFHRKWIEGSAARDDSLLGNADVQSLADTGNSFRFVNEMRIVPFGRGAVALLAVAIALPILPLVLLVMPIRDILSRLINLAL